MGKLAKFIENWQILQNFANFWRARSRLYQNEILQENMRWTAFFKLYKMCTLLHRSKLNSLAKHRFRQNSATILQVLKMLARAKRERVVQDGVEKANRRHGPAPLAPYLKFDHF